MKIIFNSDRHARGWGTDNYMGNTSNELFVQLTETELNDLLADVLEDGENWKDKYNYLSIDDEDNVCLDTDRVESE